MNHTVRDPNDTLNPISLEAQAPSQQVAEKLYFS